MEVHVPLAPSRHSWSLPVDHKAAVLSSILPSSASPARTVNEDLSIPDLPLFIEARSHALANPYKAAIIDKTKNQSLTFVQLLNDVAVRKDEILQYLASRNGLTVAGSEEEPRVAFLAPPGYDYVVTQWAIWAAGGVCVPLCMCSTNRIILFAMADLGRHFPST